MKNSRGALLVALSSILLFIRAGIVFSEERQAPDPVIIGCIVDLTDPASLWGPAIKKGAELAVERLNAAVGDGGIKYELRVYEAKSDPLECLNYYIRLADRDKAAAVIGPPAGAGSYALANLSYAKRVPVVSLNPDPRVLERRDGSVQPYMFLIQPSADRSAGLLADYGTNELGYRGAAILRDQTSSFAALQAKSFTAVWEKNGGKTVLDLPYKEGEKDFRPFFAKIKESGADCVFAPAGTREIVLMAEHAAESGLACGFFAGMAPPKPCNEAFPPAKAGRFLFVENCTDSEPPASEILGAFRGKYGEFPVNKAFLAYDAVLVIADAVGRVKASNSMTVKEGLEQVKDLRGATGALTISVKTHQPVEPSQVVTAVEEGVLKNLGRYPPESPKR